jgi:glycosyltransferase involved in cell wall biosynthesis
MTLRVLQIIPTLDQGGAEKQMCLLASGLDRAQFECHVATLTRDGPRRVELDQAGIPVHSVQKRAKVDPWAMMRLNGIVRKLKPDIVHTWLFAANCYGRAAALWNRVPVIIGGERCVDPWKSISQLWIDRFLSRRSNAIITNSSGVVDFYSERGVRRDIFHVIPNGIPPSKATTISRHEAYERLGVPSDRQIIACVGRLWPQKGHSDLFWAMELFRVVRDGTMLVVIGDGPLRQRLEHLRDQYQMADCIRMVGERQDVAELMPHFSLLIHASHYEGQSNVIMEAMQARVPVVASDIPGNRDLVVPGLTGELFPMGDAELLARKMMALMADENLRERMGVEAKKRIEEHFSVQSMIDRHQALYQQLFQQA